MSRVINRYNLSFVQSRTGEEGNTVSLSDQKPAASSSSSTGALPQTLSELLEDECALLE